MDPKNKIMYIWYELHAVNTDAISYFIWLWISRIQRMPYSQKDMQSRNKIYVNNIHIYSLCV